MARLPLTKQQLAHERRNLSTYRRYLPSLDLKRKQLMTERARVAAHLDELDRMIRAEIERVGAQIPMLAFDGLDLSGLVSLRGIKRGERNVVGVRLPTLEGIEIAITPYGFMTRPHWVDLVARKAEAVLRLEAERAVAREAMVLLDAAVVKATQRLNLFDKVLIPDARNNIRRIGIALGDRERAAVVTSKIAKRKHGEGVG